MSAGTVAYYQERLIRLKPGLQINNVWIKNPKFIKPYVLCSLFGYE
jgi:hypothetical protein